MRKILLLVMFSVLLLPLAGAHAIDKGPVRKSTDDYIIEFSTNPKFPVTGKQTHLDFIVKNKENAIITGADMELELHRQETTIALSLNEEEESHYSIEYKFTQEGEYALHLIINNKEVEIAFQLEVASFGLSGLLRSGVILFFLFILIGLMLKDCRRCLSNEK